MIDDCRLSIGHEGFLDMERIRKIPECSRHSSTIISQQSTIQMGVKNGF